MQVTQLTGFSDPVYAEAYVHVNQYDIVLDVLIVNQTSDTLQNLTLELATLGKDECTFLDKFQPILFGLFSNVSQFEFETSDLHHTLLYNQETWNW